MARMRTIKPSFFTNDVLAEIPPLGRILFSGLWCIADREGRLEDRPKRIKAELLPYDACDVSHLLNELAKRGFVLRYQMNGTRYIQIVNFTKHQTPHIKESPSVIPEPDEHGASTVQAPDKPDLTRARSGFLVPGSGNLEVGSGERERPPHAHAREDFSPSSPNLSDEAAETLAAELATTPDKVRTAIIPQWADKRPHDKPPPANGWLADLRSFGRAFLEREPQRGTNGARASPVTFEQQREENNRKADAEFTAILNGRGNHGSGTVQSPDQPPRRRLSG